MRSETLCAILFLIVAFVASAFAEQKDSCTSLRDVKVPGVEITKAAHVEAAHRADSLEPESQRPSSGVLPSRGSSPSANCAYPQQSDENTTSMFLRNCERTLPRFLTPPALRRMASDEGCLSTICR